MKEKPIGEVVFSTLAKRKLEHLLEYLEIKWSLKVKHDFISKLDNALLRTVNFPRSCPVSQKRAIYKCIVSKQTSLYYRLKDDRIEVITFFDNRQNPSELKL